MKKYSFLAMVFLFWSEISEAIDKSELYGNYRVEAPNEESFTAEVNEIGIVLRKAHSIHPMNIFNGTYGDFLSTKAFGPFFDHRALMEYNFSLDSPLEDV